MRKEKINDALVFFLCMRVEARVKKQERKLYENVMYGLYGNNGPNGPSGPNDLNGPLGW